MSVYILLLFNDRLTLQSPRNEKKRVTPPLLQSPCYYEIHVFFSPRQYLFGEPTCRVYKINIILYERA